MPAIDKYELVQLKINEIEAEIKKLGLWQNKPLEPEKYHNMGPFGMHTMAAAEWLQYILIPNVNALIANKGAFPADSKISSWAVKNFDYLDGNSQLIQLLFDFDRLFS